MIMSKESAMQQVNDLLCRYNKLRISKMDEKEIILTGLILVNRVYGGFHVCEEYSVKIVIPIGSKELPFVVDAGNHIADDYPHRYSNGTLCLETDTNMRIRFIDGLSLVKWMSEYVEAYYFSYEYFQRYGEFPFGERAHGYIGVIQTYADFFDEPDLVKTFNLMDYISTKKYRGHILCPCGSGKRLRDCHGTQIKKFLMTEELREIVRKDILVAKKGSGE